MDQQHGRVGTPPAAIVVMGVSGSGKSTLGACLATALGCRFLEGDSFHSPTSVAKMSAGRALDDADRWPWLDRLGAAIAGGPASVVACSALRHAYRDRLIVAVGRPLLFVLLDAARQDLASRLVRREGHYMPASLLDSQLATLERPAAAEQALTLDAAAPREALCIEACAWARTRGFPAG